jgi:TadE-like protein
MAEFAIIAPVFLLIVVGMLVCGRLFFYWIEANHVANETARWAVVDRNPYAPGQTLQLHARSSATNEFEDNTSVCISFPEADPSDPNDPPELGEPVRVQVEIPVAFASFFGFDVTIRGSSTMRIERLAATDADDNAIPENYTATCSP